MCLKLFLFLAVVLTVVTAPTWNSNRYMSYLVPTNQSSGDLIEVHAPGQYVLLLPQQLILWSVNKISLAAAAVAQLLKRPELRSL